MKYDDMLSLLKYVENSAFQNFEIDFENTYINVSKDKYTGRNENFVDMEERPEIKTQPFRTEETPVKPKEVTRPMTILPDDDEPLSGCTVNSPIVGTFYESSSPDKPAYIKIGDEIKEGDVLCIIEAMKVMNEVKSKVSGKVSRILVDNESIVEYNQPLFLIDECK